MSLVEFFNVYSGYNTKNPILKDVSFSLGKGDFVGLLGPNGSGENNTFKSYL